MPEISRFFGIVIKMYIDDHPPPHFHVEYSEHRAIVGIRTLTVIDGYPIVSKTIGALCQNLPTIGRVGRFLLVL